MKPQNQTVLTGIIALAMISAFVGVYYVSADYETSGVSEVVYISNSNLEFAEIDTTIIAPEIPQPYGLGSYKITSGVWTKNNATGVYQGNNTWGASMIGFAGETPLYASALHYIPIAIMEAKTFVADTVTINLTMPTDITLQIFLGGHNDPQGTLLTPGVQLVSTAMTTQTTYDHEFTLSPYQKLQWYSAAQQYDIPNLVIYMYDTDRDGMSSFALELSITIEGKIATTWSLQDSVNAVVGVCTGINIVLGIYMLDGVDFNAVRKDLPNKTRGKGPKNKKGGRW